MIQAVVFDMDGVIFDSERLVIECWKKVAGEKGFTGVEDVCCICLGTNDVQTRAKFLEVYGEDFPYDTYEREMAGLFHEKADGGQLPKKAGVDALLTFLKERGLMIALATSSKERTVRREIEEAGLLSYFDAIVCGDMIRRSKPEPDIYLKACECLQVELRMPAPWKIPLTACVPPQEQDFPASWCRTSNSRMRRCGSWPAVYFLPCWK